MVRYIRKFDHQKFQYEKTRNKKTETESPRSGIQFAGFTGKNNAITDVAGVEVGYSTIIVDGSSNAVGQRVSLGIGAVRGRGAMALGKSFSHFLPQTKTLLTETVIYSLNQCPMIS
jgi:hypothetical protein